MLGTVHEYEILILEQHLDTFGHVNNATYLELFEEARWDLITRNGYGLERVQQSRIGPTILEANLRFMREVKNRSRMLIKTFMESYQGKVGVLVQQMCDGNGQLCCEASFKLALFDLEKRKLIPPTPEWWQAVGLAGVELPA